MNGDWKNLEYDDLPNSGYVIDTMVTALWCFIILTTSRMH